MKKALPLKGLVKVRRDARIIERTSSSLSREAEEAFFAAADVLSEGSAREHRDGSATYFGSTMLSVSFDALSRRFRGTFDEAMRERVGSLVEGSVRVRLRVVRLARAQALERLGGRSLGTVRAETHVRVTDEALLVDIDLEAPVEIASKMRRR